MKCFPEEEFYDDKKNYLKFYSFEEDEEGGTSVVLHVVVHTQRQPVGQHLLYY